MPFMKGQGALRRTKEFLEKGSIFLREDVEILTFGYNPGKQYKHHDGLNKFVFWHLPQLQYKNPRIQMLTFTRLTPTPWIKAYFRDESSMVIDCDSRSREEIHGHVRRVLGKSDIMLAIEQRELEAKVANPANFGFTYARQCMCEMPGQVPCPGWQPLPKEMTGKWKTKMAAEES